MEDFCIEYFKTLVREIKENLNKWRIGSVCELEDPILLRQQFFKTDYGFSTIPIRILTFCVKQAFNMLGVKLQKNVFLSQNFKFQFKMFGIFLQNSPMYKPHKKTDLTRQLLPMSLGLKMTFTGLNTYSLPLSSKLILVISKN